MKSILIPVEEGAGLRSQLETAALAAHLFASHLAGVAPRSDFSNYLVGAGAGVGATIPVALEDLQKEEAERVERAHLQFQDFVRRHKMPLADPALASKHVTAEWITDIDAGDSSIAQLARVFDLTILPRPTANAPVSRRQLLETALFESGRPILMAPPDVPATLGRVVLIAWNGSTESARAISFAKPFLAQAERVVVLEVEGGMVDGPPGSAVARMLNRAGIVAETKSVRQEGRSTGQAILAESARHGADLIVKGAYTHSRLRQLIFGGATTHLLSEADRPVLMAH